MAGSARRGRGTAATTLGSRGPARARDPRASLRAAALLGLLGCTAGLACGRTVADGRLAPPPGWSASEPWSQELEAAFDDGFTPTPPQLEGRAPHDVRDQGLLRERLGRADLVLLGTAVQSRARGRYRGALASEIDVRVERVVLGERPKGLADEQTLAVAGEELPAQGARVLVFVRWRDEDPDRPFRLHVMPATPEVVAWVDAMVASAEEAGVLRSDGKRRGRAGKRRAARSR